MPKGFAGMSPEKRRRIARLGGLKLSADVEHMAKIGKLGGQKISEDLEHMSEIGVLGGTASGKSKQKAARKTRKAK